jgi:hypothetical protein
MAKARKSKARKPAKKTVRTKAKASRVAAARSSKARAAAARSARAKKPARKAPVRKVAAKKAPPKKAVAAKRPPVRAASRPAPVLAAPVAAPAPVQPPAATAAEPAANMGDGGEAAEEDKPKPSGGIREAVASFATQGRFREAAKRLVAAGFAPADLSILASHDSLEVAGGVPGYRAKPGQALVAGLTEEANLLAPLQVAGFSALSGGPVAAAVATVVTAGIGAMGLRDVIERFVANRHSADYVEALKAGSLLLWVRVAGARQEWKALDILVDSGGTNAHVNARPARPA